ncbi:MAG: magnesium transporter [Gemmatimonadota bacterium]
MTEMTDRLAENVRFVERLLETGAGGELQEFVAGMHASDVADILERLDEDEARLRFLELLPASIASDALSEMEEVERPAELLARMDGRRIAELVDELADDDAADLIGGLEAEDQARVLSAVEGAEEIRELLEYPEDTAGGIMTRELVSLASHLTAGQALEEVRRQAHDVADFYVLFVVDSDRRLEGVVSLQHLALADPEVPIRELTEETPAVVPVDMDQEEVGRILARYNLPAIGVVDPLGRLVGRITFDDVIDVIEAETTEDILRFASVSEEEEIRGTTRDAIRSRLPWLVVNLGTAILAASVVYAFQDTISQLVVLAAIMPIIAGMGGNAGTQALAVTVRRVALSDETLKERWRVVAKELLVGVTNGLVIGIIVAAAGLLLVDQALFGLVVMLAMWGNMIVASLAGAFIPILLESVGVDPAVASSVFVTTFTDLFGFFLLLGLATAILL